MQIKGYELLAEFPVNGSYIIGIYQGSISDFDILIKYRQLENDAWSRIRTPKHIHWAIDILIKQYSDIGTTDHLLDFFLELWNRTAPIRTEEERVHLFGTDNLLEEVNTEAAKYTALANHGEYSVDFLILLAKLFMVQEKTNRNDDYIFKTLLEQLREHNDIFRIVSTVTYYYNEGIL